MTDIRNSGTPREVLFATNPALTVSGIVREVLVTTPTALTMTGLVREVLLMSPPPVPVGPPGSQTVISIMSG